MNIHYSNFKERQEKLNDYISYLNTKISNEQKIGQALANSFYYRELGMQPPLAPPTSLASDLKDITKQQEIAFKNLLEITDKNSASAIVADLQSLDNVVAFNSYFGLFKEAVKGQTNITPIVFSALWNSFISKLSDEGKIISRFLEPSSSIDTAEMDTFIGLEPDDFDKFKDNKYELTEADKEEISANKESIESIKKEIKQNRDNIKQLSRQYTDARKSGDESSMEDIKRAMSETSIKINEAQRNISLLKQTNQGITKKYKYTLGGDNELLKIIKEIETVKEDIDKTTQKLRRLRPASRDPEDIKNLKEEQKQLVDLINKQEATLNSLNIEFNRVKEFVEYSQGTRFSQAGISAKNAFDVLKQIKNNDEIRIKNGKNPLFSNEEYDEIKTYIDKARAGISPVSGSSVDPYEYIYLWLLDEYNNRSLKDIEKLKEEIKVAKLDISTKDAEYQAGIKGLESLLEKKSVGLSSSQKDAIEKIKNIYDDLFNITFRDKDINGLIAKKFDRDPTKFINFYNISDIDVELIKKMIKDKKLSADDIKDIGTDVLNNGYTAINKLTYEAKKNVIDSILNTAYENRIIDLRDKDAKINEFGGDYNRLYEFYEPYEVKNIKTNPIYTDAETIFKGLRWDDEKIERYVLDTYVKSGYTGLIENLKRINDNVRRREDDILFSRVERRSQVGRLKPELLKQIDIKPKTSLPIIEPIEELGFSITPEPTEEIPIIEPIEEKKEPIISETIIEPIEEEAEEEAEEEVEEEVEEVEEEEEEKTPKKPLSPKSLYAQL
ncbi:MAG: hypothetical protein RLZZ203_2358, partial [Cyanobacteriota bacterium]